MHILQKQKVKENIFTFKKLAYDCTHFFLLKGKLSLGFGSAKVEQEVTSKGNYLKSKLLSLYIETVLFEFLLVIISLW